MTIRKTFASEEEAKNAFQELTGGGEDPQRTDDDEAGYLKFSVAPSPRFMSKEFITRRIWDVRRRKAMSRRRSKRYYHRKKEEGKVKAYSSVHPTLGKAEIKAVEEAIRLDMNVGTGVHTNA